MADEIYDNAATEKRPQQGTVPGKGDAHSVKVLCAATIELAAASDGDTVSFGRIPSNARLLPTSFVYWDDLATNGSPTLDIGLASVGSNITSDDDALSNGHDVTSAGTAAALTASTSHSAYGDPAWDFVNGVTSDPKGELDVYGTIQDAATTQTGTVTVLIYGYLD